MKTGSPKQVKPSGLIPKHKQPFFLTLFPNLTFFQTMKTQNVIQILELNQPTSTLPAQPRTRYAKPTPPSNPSMGPPYPLPSPLWSGPSTNPL